MRITKEENYYLCTNKSKNSLMEIVVRSILFMFGFGRNPLPDRPNRKLHQSDFDAIRSDWENIGNDFFNAIRQYETQQAKI